MKINRVTIVIPVYNEAKTLEKVLAEVKNVKIGDLEKEVILVDDCSTDRTREILAKINEPGWKIFFQEKNLGKGAALRRGFKESSGDVVVVQDADLEYDPAEIWRIVRPFTEGAEVVYGSRYLHPTPGLPFFHSLFNKTFTKVSNLFTGQKITDVMTCYKAFSRKVLQDVLPKLEADRFGFEPEITAKLSRAEFKIFEVPVSYRPRGKKEGKHMNLRGELDSLWAIFKYSIKH